MLTVIGTCVEITTLGDKDDMREPADAEALHEAAKFRRLAQYDAVLL